MKDLLISSLRDYWSFTDSQYIYNKTEIVQTQLITAYLKPTVYDLFYLTN